MNTSPQNGKRGRKSQAAAGYVNFRLLKRQSDAIDDILIEIRKERPEVTKQAFLNETVDRGLDEVVRRRRAEHARTDSTVLTSPV